MPILICPSCGSIHECPVTKRMIYSCKNCQFLFIGNEGEEGTTRCLNSVELHNIDTDEMLGLPSEFRIGKGKPIPMLSGHDANLMLGENFYHIPRNFSFLEMLYTAREQGENPVMLNLDELLQRHLDSTDCMVDVWKLKAALSPETWNMVNDRFHFLVE